MSGSTCRPPLRPRSDVRRALMHSRACARANALGYKDQASHVEAGARGEHPPISRIMFSSNLDTSCPKFKYVKQIAYNHI